MSNNNIDKAKHHFLKTFAAKKNPLYIYLPKHVTELEKWIKKILPNYPGVDREVLFLSVWLHDIGQAVGNNNDDHAVKSETETRRFLGEIGLKPKEIEKVAHCVRAHRCRDVQPETLEAKLLAAADSASHMTDFCYIDMVSEKPKKLVLEKLERDHRDAGLIPELQKEITPLYEAWEKLLSAYPDEFTSSKRKINLEIGRN